MDVFAVTLKPLVQDVLAGYEAAIFAYGQTGTGKTYTMEGDLDSSERRGLVPRAAEALIQALVRGGYKESSVTASCLEIYNEELIDLLFNGGQQPKLDLLETGHGICCTGLSEVPVSSVAEIHQLICRAQERRRVAETRVNARSSRSHCIFTLRVSCRQALADGEVEAAGKLHLVDLAGSECARKADERLFVAGAGGHDHQEACVKGERERRNINQSLLTLGRVIAALRDESSRVPYRDSKLTRLLQEALGGNSRTVMIATISPAQNAIDETISTLQYAEQASGIQNRAAASVHFCRTTPSGSPTGDQRFMSFGEFQSGVGGVVGENSVETLEMRVEYLTQEVEEAQAAFERKQREVQDLHGLAEAAEAERTAALARLEEAQRSLLERTFVLERMADFADGQTATAQQLLQALEASLARCSHCTQKLQEQREVVGAVRSQVNGLHASATNEALSLREACEKAVDEVCCGTGQAFEAHVESADALAKVITKHGELLGSITTTVHDCGKQLLDHLGGAAASGAEAAAAEDAAAAKRCDSLAEAVDSTVGVANAALDHVVAGVDERSAAADKQLLALEEDAKSGAVHLGDALVAAIATSRASRAASEAAHAEELQALGKDVQQPLIGLQDALTADGEEATKLCEMVGSIGCKAEADEATASIRFSGVAEAMGTLSTTHAAASKEHAEAMQHALVSLESSLGSHGRIVGDALSGAAAQVAAARQVLQECGPLNHRAVEQALDMVHQAIADARGRAVQDLGHAREILERVAACQSEGGQQLGASAASASSAADALAEAAREGSGSLLSEHEAVAEQVMALREQRAAEQTLLAQLSNQREALCQEVQQLQDRITRAASHAAEAGAAVEAAEEEQRRRREEVVGNVVRGVEALLRSELEDLHQQLATKGAAAQAQLEETNGLTTEAIQIADSFRESISCTSQEAAAVAVAWSAAVEGACNSIHSAEQRAAVVVKQVAEAAEVASRELHSAGSVANVWASACNQGSSDLTEGAAAASSVLASQEALSLQWASQYEAAASAAKAWAQGSEDVQGTLLVAVEEKHRKAGDGTAALLADALARRAEAQGSLSNWALAEGCHDEAIAGLLELHAAGRAEDAAAALQRQQALASIAELSAASCSRTRCGTDEALSLGRASSAFASRLAAAAEARGRASLAAEVNVEVLQKCLEDARGRSASHIGELRSAQATVAREARELAAGSASKVAGSLDEVRALLEEHKAASARAAGAVASRWEALQHDPAPALLALEAATVAAVEAAAASASQGNREAATARAKAEASRSEVLAATKEQAARLGELAGLPGKWNLGLVVEQLAACEAEDMGMEVHDVFAKASAALNGLENVPLNIAQRPSEESLLAEFRKAADLVGSGAPPVAKSPTIASAVTRDAPRRGAVLVRSNSGIAAKRTMGCVASTGVGSTGSGPRPPLRELQPGAVPVSAAW